VGDLTRYWITFDYSVWRQAISAPEWIEPVLGFGVTALDIDDALGIIHREWFGRYGLELPPVQDVTENVDVSAIQDRLGQIMSPIPFMNPPTARGIWFPTTTALR
jgi:hypothetical protein